MDKRHQVERHNVNPAIISIGAGVSQLPLILTAKQMGWAVVAVDRDSNAPGFKHADLAINVSTHDTLAVYSALCDKANMFNFIGTIARTTAAEALYTATFVSEKFGLQGLSRKLVQISTEKSSLREFCSLNNLPVPKGIRLNSQFHGIEEIPGPFVIKPDQTSVGKTDIYICHNNEKFFPFITKAAKASNNQRVEVESFIEGIDVTCLCWAHYGHTFFIAWWDELVGIEQNNKIIGIGVSIPSVITNKSAQRKTEKVVADFINHFPDVDALILVSLRITMDGEPFIIEVHADLGGDLIADVLLPSANSEFDFFELAIKIATGGVSNLSPVNFKPMVLYYDRKRLRCSRFNLEGISDCFVIQSGTIKENLKYLYEEIIPSEGLALSVLPMHFEWLKNNHI
ncbi:hypothetical protein JXL19_09665 [bacterium]|nr:hypothetical protein [bacterium]